MHSLYDTYFKDNMTIIEKSLKSIDKNSFDRFIRDVEAVLRRGNKVIASGLGKNVPICDKFIGSMVSLGLNASFMHTNSAVHGDLGLVHEGDLVIILTKSGSTTESVYLEEILSKRKNVIVWLLTSNDASILGRRCPNKIVFNVEHEGDKWNIMPNNSTTINLIILQTVAMEMAKRLNIDLEDFKPNHPGGAIGTALSHLGENHD